MKNLFVGELRKNVKKSALIGVCVALVVVLVLAAVIYNLLHNTLKEIINDALQESGQTSAMFPENDGYEIGKDQLDREIEKYEQYVSELQEKYKDNKKLYGELFEAKNTLNALKYAEKNGYYDKEVRILGYNYSVSAMNAEGLVSVYSSIAGVILLIYGIVLASGIYSKEYRFGTIKLVMSKPIKKNALTTAKLLTVYATIGVLYLVSVLIAYVYGAVAFGTDATAKVIYGFNATSAGISTAGAFAFADIFMTLVQMLVMSTIAFALGTLSRKYAIGLLALVLVFLNIGGLLNYIGVTAFLLSNSFDLLCFFGMGTVVRNGNFFLSVGIIVFWTAAALASTYVVTKKRDAF